MKMRTVWLAVLMGVVCGIVIGAQGAKAKRQPVTWSSAHASWYGPGFYGNAGACGLYGRDGLQPDDIGVAHKSLPCGTKLRMRYKGRYLTVRVTDRGPYVAGRDFDLTAGARAVLRFPNGVAYVQWRKVRR